MLTIPGFSTIMADDTVVNFTKDKITQVLDDLDKEAVSSIYNDADSTTILVAIAFFLPLNFYTQDGIKF
jgi:hypothetical protein